MHLPPQPAEREHEEDIRLGLQQIHQLVVDVADHVREPIHPGAHQRLDVDEARRMNDDPHLALVRLVDDRLVKRRRELLDRPAPGIDPGLDHLDAVGGQLRNRLPRVVLGRDQMRRVPHVVWLDLVDRSEPAAGREKSCRVRVLSGPRLVAQPEWQIAEIGAHGHARGNPEVSELVHVIEDVLARVILRSAAQVAHVADVRMGIDQRRDDGLAREIDARGTGRNLHVGTAPGRNNAVALNDERGIFDDAGVAVDQPRTLEHRHGCGLSVRRRVGSRQEQTDSNKHAPERRVIHQDLPRMIRPVMRPAVI